MKTLSILKPYEVLKSGLKSIPLVQAWREWNYEQKFAADRWQKLFRGVFENFQEAARSAPHNKKIGYDHPEAAAMCKKCLIWICPSDYPMLFWLSRVLQDGMRVFDYGGNLGNFFYSCRQYITFPRDIQWIVYDLPEVVKAGREVARGVDSTGLSFTTDVSNVEHCDVLLASSVLQYVERPLPELLDSLKRPPQHVLLNKLPLRDGPGFVTLQNIGTAFCPYNVYNRMEFVDGFRRVGYRVRDRWENPEFRCHIPFHPDKFIPAYSGMYLVKSDVLR